VKNLGAVIIGGLTVFSTLLVGIYILWPVDASPQPNLVINIDADLAPVEAELSLQEAELEAELDALKLSLQQKQSALDAQNRAWETEAGQLRLRLDHLKSTNSTLQTKVTQLETTHTLVLSDFQNEADFMRQSYQEEIDQLQAELNEKEARLSALTPQTEP
jgi:chromosome segregation ATPase